MTTNMKPSAEERLRYEPTVPFAINAIKRAYRDGAAAERVKILALLRGLPDEISERVADTSYVTTGDVNDVALALADEIEKELNR